METIFIEYRFKFETNVEERFHLQLDAQTAELVKTKETLPSWTALTFHQCSHCPLRPDTHPDCPLAAHLANIVTRFNQFLPYAKVHLDVVTAERSISQDTTVQAGVGSLMGLVMSTSGCPYTAVFRPMARFHLPLASAAETMYRAVSTYLMAQYFLNKEKKDVDFSLKGLEQIYENIHTVNTGIAERLLSASKKDSTVDAVVQLDIYAMTFLGILEEPLEEIRPLFKAYFKK